MFVVKTEDTRFFPKKTTEKIGKEFVQSQQWKIWKMMFLSKRYNNQVVEPMQGNDLTQTSQHSPPKVQDHKPKGFAKDSAPKKILYPPIPPNFPSRTSQGATNYTSLKLTAEAQGNKKKHPKKNQFPKCRQFQGIHPPISPPHPRFEPPKLQQAFAQNTGPTLTRCISSIAGNGQITEHLDALLPPTYGFKRRQFI